MRGIRTLSTTLVVLAGLAVTTSTALGAEPPQPLAAKAKGKLKILTDGQKDILEKNGIRVRAKVKEAGKLKTSVRSKTFDVPKFTKLGRSKKARANDTGKVKLIVRLNDAALDDISECEARAIEVGVGKASGRFELVRDTGRCKPRRIDLADAKDCDFIAEPSGECMLPFPDDFHTARDPDTQTGRVVDFRDAAMPVNASGAPIDAAPYNGNDGFSPGQTAVVKVPGLDTAGAFENTDPVPLNELSDYARKKAPIVVINARTGERQPIWAELDANATTPESTSLLIHPAVNYDPGERYIVAMRNLEDETGDDITAPQGFRYYRDDLPSKKKPIERQRKRFEKVFKNLRNAEIDRANLYLAWDFTVASDANIAERMLAIRDDAFAQLGDTDLSDVTVQGNSPSFTVDSVEDFTPAQDPEMARRVRGTFQVPCYLVPDCAPGGTFQLGPNGLPSQNGTWTANFNCMIPRVAVAPGATPARPQVYGHGLLGSANEATSNPQQLIGQTHNFVVCATDTIGFSNPDIGNIASNILTDLGNFPQLTDRVQQGLLCELFLGRLMIHPGGFASSNAFRANQADPSSPSTLDTSRLYYNGNSQGGILGGALTAVAPDFTRASLGVPAMNYSVLLNRSIDFDTYKAILGPAYPDPMTQQLALSLIQMLWDRSEANGYAHRMTDAPLPNTPSHEVLMNVAFGDHQVTTWQADVEARTIGASIHNPVVYEGRWPGVEVGWGIDPIQSYPFTDSAIVYWDSGPTRANPAPPPDVLGTDPPPVANLPNRSGVDPHGLPRVAPAEMQMVSDFLQPDAQSHITDTCNGAPCFAGGFNGP
ncbi:MAG TPA: hypothetical protein VFY99_08310 [Solirubrobacterales bacterium]